MKNSIISILILFSIQCWSQENDDKKFKNIHFDYININSPKEKANTTLPFSVIEVHDCRYDTSCIGILQAYDNYLTLLKFKKPLTDKIKQFYASIINTLNSKETTLELHCFIKKLVLSNFINTPLTIEEQKQSSGKFDAAERSGLMLIIEFYAKKDSVYFPLYRFDTTVTGPHNIIEGAKGYLSGAITASIKKATSLNYETMITKGKRLSPEDINDFNLKRFDLPVLNNPLTKGIYLTFDDFRNNRVSDRQFTVDQNKKGDFLYIKNEKGEETLFTDLWGYCDGKDIFIYSASNYFKLYRIGHSFKIYGAKDYTRNRVMRLDFRLIDIFVPNSNFSKERTRAKYDLVKSFLQLDMETGELY